MNANILKSKSSMHGVGLVEVLVALIIVSLGLLAVAALNSQLASSIGLGKARSEAVVLAELKLEELRNIATVAAYDDVTAGTITESNLIGQNTSYTRITTLSKETGPERIKALVEVTWGAGSQNETINLSGEYFFSDFGAVSVSTTPGSGPVGQSPSPKQNSSTEGAAPGQPSVYSPGTGTGLGDGSGLLKHEDSAGNLILLDNSGNVLQTFFGDVINTFKGTVYTVNNLDTIEVNVSETGGYCWFDKSNNDSEQEYICYIAGDCSNGGVGCPVSPTIPSFVGPGGWFGVIGISGLGVSGGTQEKMCFPNVTGYASRAYKTVRTDGSAVTSEGINRAYACQDFLIVNENGQNSNCSTVLSNMDLNLAPQSIVRVLNGNSSTAPNTVLSEDTSNCVASVNDCTAPWGSTIGDTVSVTAFLNASDPIACTSETRTCNAGTLSGSYSFPTCNVQPDTQNCTTPWGDSINDGNTVTAFLSASDPSACTSQQRLCSGGTLSGSYLFKSCTVVAVSCTVPNLVGDNTSNAAQILAVDAEIIANDFVVGNKTNSGSGQKKVQSQTPAAGTSIACGSAINYIYNN